MNTKKRVFTSVQDAGKRSMSEQHRQAKILNICVSFRSSSKFDSHCGWPAFSSSIGTSVRRQKDKDGRREEILCTNCDGHLGSFFESQLPDWT